MINFEMNNHNTPVKAKHRKFMSEKKMSNYTNSRFLRTYNQGTDLSEIPMSESRMVSDPKNMNMQVSQVSMVTQDRLEVESSQKVMDTIEDTEQMKHRFGMQGETSIVEIQGDQVGDFMGGHLGSNQKGSREIISKIKVSPPSKKENYEMGKDQSEYKTNSCDTEDIQDEIQSSMIRAIGLLNETEGLSSPNRARFMSRHGREEATGDFRSRFYTNVDRVQIKDDFRNSGDSYRSVNRYQESEV